jgi:hypothetical protein
VGSVEGGMMNGECGPANLDRSRGCMNESWLKDRVPGPMLKDIEVE